MIPGYWLMKRARPVFVKPVVDGLSLYYGACRNCRCAVGPVWALADDYTLPRYCPECFRAGAFRCQESEPDYPAGPTDDPPVFMADETEGA